MNGAKEVGNGSAGKTRNAKARERKEATLHALVRQMRTHEGFYADAIRALNNIRQTHTFILDIYDDLYPQQKDGGNGKEKKQGGT